MVQKKILVSILVGVAMAFGTTSLVSGNGQDPGPIYSCCMCGEHSAFLCHSKGTSIEKTVCVDVHAVSHLLEYGNFTLGQCEDPCGCCVGDWPYECYEEYGGLCTCEPPPPL